MVEKASLGDILSRQGYMLDKVPLKALEKLAVLLQRESRTTNLTAVEGYEDILVRHILDSLMPVVRGWQVPRGRGCDVGTGAGFPGLVYALIGEGESWELIDSKKNKIKWIQSAIEELGLDRVVPVRARVEELGRAPEHREQYDLCLARAVAVGTVMLEYCLPLVKVGGELWTWQGESFRSSDWIEALATLGGDLSDEVEYTLPGWERGGKKRVIRICKSSATPERFPRRTGIPKKRPLSG